MRPWPSSDESPAHTRPRSHVSPLRRRWRSCRARFSYSAAELRRTALLGPAGRLVGFPETAVGSGAVARARPRVGGSRRSGCAAPKGRMGAQLAWDPYRTGPFQAPSGVAGCMGRKRDGDGSCSTFARAGGDWGLHRVATGPCGFQRQEQGREDRAASSPVALARDLPFGPRPCDRLKGIRRHRDPVWSLLCHVHSGYGIHACPQCGTRHQGSRVAGALLVPLAPGAAQRDCTCFSGRILGGDLSGARLDVSWASSSALASLPLFRLSLGRRGGRAPGGGIEPPNQLYRVQRTPRISSCTTAMAYPCFFFLLGPSFRLPTRQSAQTDQGP